MSIKYTDHGGDRTATIVCPDDTDTVRYTPDGEFRCIGLVTQIGGSSVHR